MLPPVFRKERKRRGLVISVEREKGGEGGGGGGGVTEAKYTFRFVLRWAYYREVGGSICISGDA